MSEIAEYRATACNLYTLLDAMHLVIESGYNNKSPKQQAAIYVLGNVAITCICDFLSKTQHSLHLKILDIQWFIKSVRKKAMTSNLQSC